MAYWVQETGEKHSMSNRRSFMCDYRSDINKLPRYDIKGEECIDDSISPQPCSWGSNCLCLADTSVWILGKDTNTWQEV